VKYDIKGVNAPEDGASVFLVDALSSECIDSAVVADGAPDEGKADKDAFMNLNVLGSNWTFRSSTTACPCRWISPTTRSPAPTSITA
jgi:hypothetical protein